MKLGVFGDSYSLDGEKSWVGILNEQLKSDMSNYSVGGSSFDYSYFQFRKYNQYFDKIIFIVTSINRGSIFTLEDDNPKHLAFYQNIDLKSLRSLNRQTKSRIDDKLLKIVKSEIIKNTYYESNIIYHLSYLDSIKYHRPDANIIFAFDFPTVSQGCMRNISMLDCNKLRLPEYQNDRVCHMSNLQNQEFANYMKQHIETDFDVHSTLVQPKQFYTVSQSKEDANWL